MDRKSYLEIFRKTEALLEGHFILTSGLHSATYFQCAKVLQYPQYLKLFSRTLADIFKTSQADVVISPAVGGIVIGTAVGLELGLRTIFTERIAGTMNLRRGFELKQGERVLIIEDVITTGGSVKEVVSLVNSQGAKITGVGVIVNRSNGKVTFNNQCSLVSLEVVSYAENEIPDELKKIPGIKPGSRSI